MGRFLLIESRDGYEFADVAYFYDLAHGLRREGHEVTFFLVQNAVLAARRGPGSTRASELAQGGVRVVADSFSLRERGIAETSLAPGVAPAPIDLVVDLLADGETRAMWH
jgi:hypothetical protein